MFIQFNHTGESLKAEMIYNFKQIKNAVLVKNLPLNTSIKENVLFFRVGNNWTSESELQYRFPSTYLSLLNAIKHHFDMKEFTEEMVA